MSVCCLSLKCTRNRCRAKTSKGKNILTYRLKKLMKVHTFNESITVAHYLSPVVLIILFGVAVAAAKMLGVLPAVAAPLVVGVPTVLTDRLPGGGFLTGTTTLLQHQTNMHAQYPLLNTPQCSVLLLGQCTQCASASIITSDNGKSI